eukprot:COSAG02_NODE_27895_length_600_cov_1.622754_2_plen_158_part_01
MMMLGRLGLSIDGRVSGMPAGRGLQIADTARRRVWNWYTQVKSVMSALDLLPSEKLPAGPEDFFPSAPELPKQQMAASALWSALLAEEQASHRLTEKACGGEVIETLLNAEAEATEVDGLTPVELYKVSKDLPFRAFCVNAALPTTIAIASNRTIQEI